MERTSNNEKKEKKICIFNFIRDATLFIIIRYNYGEGEEEERKIGDPFFFSPKCNNIVVAVKWCKDVRVGKVIK